MSTAFRGFHQPHRTGRRAAGLACAALLTACGGGVATSNAGDAASPAATSTAAPPSAATDNAAGTAGGDGLAAGLLSAEDFGAEATVVEVTQEQLAEASPTDAGGLEVSPESCAAAVQGTQPQVADYDEVAGVSATTGSVTTVEVLLRGDATAGAVEQLADAVTNCPEARVTSPDFGEATLTFEQLETPDLGDGSAAVRYTTTITQDGSEVSVPTLVGLVRDGDRVITLLTLAADGSSPDEAEFTALLEQAFQVQADALG